MLIDGFSSGSVKVFFKIILDVAKLPGRTAEDPVQAAKDVFVQEVMTLEDNAFEDNTIDLDSIGKTYVKFCPFHNFLPLYSVHRQ